MQRVGQTATQAGSRPFSHAVHAEGALVGVALGVDEAGVVGTGGQAGLAADAQLGVDLDQPARRSATWLAPVGQQ